MSVSVGASAAVAVLLVCAPLRAEESASKAPVSDSVAAQPRELARVRYKQGVEAFKEGRFRDAIDSFLEADQLAPSAALSFNIGAAYEKIEQPASALRWYRDYVRRAPDSADRSQVESTIAKLEHALEQSGIQQLTVSSTPPAASLSVDGKPVGVTPWTGEIPPGSHELTLNLDGRSPARQIVVLPSDHAIDVAIELVPEERRPSSADSAAAALAPAPREDSAKGRPPAPHSSHSELRTFGWIGVAAGGAALGGALVVEILRRSEESAAEKDHTQIGYAQKLDTMDAQTTTARVLLGVGSALAVTGGVLLWLGREPAQAGQTAFGVGCGPRGCTSSLHGKF